MKAQQVSCLILKAPILGLPRPLDEVGDTVFSNRLLGDGISIDPTSQILKAPYAGKIIQVHPSHHALTLQTEEGLEILMHIGVDTVHLKGHGFKVLIQAGDNVQQGSPLIEFDADYLATHAKSLLTQVVILEPATGIGMRPNFSFLSSYDDKLMEISGFLPEPRKSLSSQMKLKFDQSGVVSDKVRIINPTGIHARPAALIVQAIKNLDAEVYLRKAQLEVKACSIVGILSLSLMENEYVEVRASGPNAAQAVREVIKLLIQQFDDKKEQEDNIRIRQATEDSQSQVHNANQFQGIPASPGIAYGRIHQCQAEELIFDAKGEDYEQESRRFQEALAQAKAEINRISKRFEANNDSANSAIFLAHLEILDDPVLCTATDRKMKQGFSAEFSWQESFHQHATQLMKAKSELIQARASDILDVGKRVLKILVGQSKQEANIPEGSILLAYDLGPSELCKLDRKKVLGFATITGGSTSHVAILARSLGIPAIAGLCPDALQIPQNSPVLLDGTQGALLLNPNATTIDTARKFLARKQQQDRYDLSHAHEKAMTADKVHIEVYANIAGVEDAAKAQHMGADGVGLLRTEFLFLDRKQAPSIDEQSRIYTEIAQALGSDKPLVVRSLDIGGDKALSYFPLEAESNPFLGVRGIRLSFAAEQLFRQQLRAILEAAKGKQFKLLFPMVTFVEEVIRLREIIQEEAIACKLPEIPFGIMVEVPTVALQADHFAAQVDFFSIGTNDLSQYTLAMDRTHPSLAKQLDSLDPGLLRLIDMTVQAAQQGQKAVSVCGGLASDPQAVPILLGLGIRELSVAIASIPSVKANIRTFQLADCRELARQALKLKSASEVRRLAQEFIDSH